jgi:hypothetical protein
MSSEEKSLKRSEVYYRQKNSYVIFCMLLTKDDMSYNLEFSLNIIRLMKTERRGKRET